MGTKARRPIRKKPESLRVRRLAPALTVNDIRESLAWYCDIVGFTVEETWDYEGRLGGATLMAGQGPLVLQQDDWKKGRDRPKGEAVRFYLRTAQDVDKIAADIEARGGTLASQPATFPWAARSFDLVDPSGFNLTITSID